MPKALDRRESLMKDNSVPLRSLAGLSILYEGDLQDLARFILRAYDTRSRGTNSRRRPTLHGLASTYSRILGVELDSIEQVLQARGLNLGATLDYDVGAVQPAAAADAPKSARR
jgi:hypothetical protein